MTPLAVDGPPANALAPRPGPRAFGSPLHWRLGLAGVLALATALRLARLQWGLPEHLFPDESWFLVPGRRMAATGDLHMDFRTYPPLVSYVLATVYWIASV